MNHSACALFGCLSGRVKTAVTPEPVNLPPVRHPNQQKRGPKRAMEIRGKAPSHRPAAGGFHSHGGFPIAGWFIKEHAILMDDD